MWVGLVLSEHCGVTLCTPLRGRRPGSILLHISCPRVRPSSTIVAESLPKWLPPLALACMCLRAQQCNNIVLTPGFLGCSPPTPLSSIILQQGETDSLRLRVLSWACGNSVKMTTEHSEWNGKEWKAVTACQTGRRQVQASRHLVSTQGCRDRSTVSPSAYPAPAPPLTTLAQPTTKTNARPGSSWPSRADHATDPPTPEPPPLPNNVVARPSACCRHPEVARRLLCHENSNHDLAMRY